MRLKGGGIEINGSVNHGIVSMNFL